MGVDYRAVIVVGLRRRDIENFDEFLGGQLEEISTNFAGNGEDHNVIGIRVAHTPDYDNEQILLTELSEAIWKAETEFKELTGQDAKIYLSVYGY